MEDLLVRQGRGDLGAVLTTLAGDLATFRDSRRPTAYGVYSHDDLAASFRPVIEDLRQSLSMVMEQTAIPIELQDRAYGVRGFENFHLTSMEAIEQDLERAWRAGFVDLSVKDTFSHPPKSQVIAPLAPTAISPK